MPKTVDAKIRKDADIRTRLSYSLFGKVKALAKRRKVSISELTRQLLQAEIDKSK